LPQALHVNLFDKLPAQLRRDPPMKSGMTPIMKAGKFPSLEKNAPKIINAPGMKKR
jgi:hypothetical protein